MQFRQGRIVDPIYTVALYIVAERNLKRIWLRLRDYILLARLAAATPLQDYARALTNRKALACN